MTHYLVECPSKPLDFTDIYNKNGGAVCMPDYNY
jgi:hypothetical protein